MHNAQCILTQMSYSRRPHQVPLLSAKNRKLRLQFTWAQKNWTIEDQFLLSLMSPNFCCQIRTVGTEFGIKQYKSMDSFCLGSTVTAAGCSGIIVWGIYPGHTLSPLLSSEHRLNATVYTIIIADQIHHTSDDYCSSSRMEHHVTKLKQS